MRSSTLTAVLASLLILAACSSKSETGTTEDPAPATPPATAPADKTSSLGDVKMPQAPDVTLAAFEDKEIEVGCGMCTYHMDGVKSCGTAVVVDGNHMLITGDWANAHSLGLCGGPSKKAVASAKVTDGKLEVTELTITQ